MLFFCKQEEKKLTSKLKYVKIGEISNKIYVALKATKIFNNIEENMKQILKFHLKWVLKRLMIGNLNSRRINYVYENYIIYLYKNRFWQNI